MGKFANFILEGFTGAQEAFYSPGQLFEVMPKLGDKIKEEDKRNKIDALVGTWSTAQSNYTSVGKKVPAYALELHAINEKGNPRDGYGTYVFLPDEAIAGTTNTIRSLFSEPIELYDDEDPLKILSALYSDEHGFSTAEQLTVYELGVQKEEFYPLKIWDKFMGIDPLTELYGLFDVLKPDEYAGISIVLVPGIVEGWNIRGRQRIRSIQDVDYQEEVPLTERIRRVVAGEDLPEEEVDRLAGYRKQQLDADEKAEIEAIWSKTKDDAQPFRCSIRIYASSPELAEQVADMVIQRTDGNARYSNRLMVTNKNGNLADLALRKECSTSFEITPGEIATIWHVADSETSGIKLHQPLPAATKPPDDLITLKTGGPGDIRYLLNKLATENV